MPGATVSELLRQLDESFQRLGTLAGEQQVLISSSPPGNGSGKSEQEVDGGREEHLQKTVQLHGETVAQGAFEKVVVLPLLLGEPTPCLYYRQAPVEPTVDELRALLQAICDKEAELPRSARLFPDGKLRSRPCYLWHMGFMASRWELRIRCGREPQAAQRLTAAGLPFPADKVVMWRMAPQMVLARARQDLPPRRDAASVAPAGGGGAADSSGGRVEYDDDFEVVRSEDKMRAHLLRSAMKSMLMTAMLEDGVLVVPDYNDFDAVHLLHDIVAEVGFRGPLVAIGVDNETLLRLDARDKGALPPEDLNAHGLHMGTRAGKNLIFAGATHAVLAESTGDSAARGRRGTAFVVDAAQRHSGSWSTRHSVLASALVIALTGRGLVLDPPERLAKGMHGVLTNGGKGTLFFTAEAVRQGIPFLVMQGSGRLSDSLDAVYPQRFNAGFDLEEACRDAIRACGFDAEPRADEVAAAKTIVTGRLIIHALVDAYPLRDNAFSEAAAKQEAAQGRCRPLLLLLRRKRAEEDTATPPFSAPDPPPGSRGGSAAARSPPGDDPPQATGVPAEQHKYVTNTLELAGAEVAAAGLRSAIGLDDDALLGHMMLDPEAAMELEFLLHGSRADLANLRYVLNGAACAPGDVPEHVTADIQRGWYHGGALRAHEYDEGHAGMRLDDFVKHNTGALARLKRSHVLALRLYTSSSFTCFNEPLRGGQCPHPFRFSVYVLAQRAGTAEAEPRARAAALHLQLLHVLQRAAAGGAVPAPLPLLSLRARPGDSDAAGGGRAAAPRRVQLAHVALPRHEKHEGGRGADQAPRRNPAGADVDDGEPPSGAHLLAEHLPPRLQVQSRGPHPRREPPVPLALSQGS